MSEPWRGIEGEVDAHLFPTWTPERAAEMRPVLMKLLRRAVAEGARLGLERPFASEDGFEEWLQDGKWLVNIASGDVDV